MRLLSYAKPSLGKKNKKQKRQKQKQNTKTKNNIIKSLKVTGKHRRYNLVEIRFITL